MKRFLTLLVTLCLLLGAACAESAAPAAAETPATLRASATAEIMLSVPHTMITFALSASGETILLAQDTMDVKSALLLDTLAAAGFQPSAVSSTLYDVVSNYEYHYTKYTDTQLLQGYTVLTSFSLQADTDAIVDIIAAVNNAGLECDYSIAFESIPADGAHDAAIASAAREAMRKAQVLAEAGGLTLGELLSIEETTQDECVSVFVTYTLK